MSASSKPRAVDDTWVGPDAIRSLPEVGRFLQAATYLPLAMSPSEISLEFHRNLCCSPLGEYVPCWIVAIAFRFGLANAAGSALASRVTPGSSPKVPPKAAMADAAHRRA